RMHRARRKDRRARAVAGARGGCGGPSVPRVKRASGRAFPNAGEGGTAHGFRRNVRYPFAAGIPELNTVAAVPQVALRHRKYMHLQPFSACTGTRAEAYPQRRETMRFSPSTSTLRRAPLNSRVTA